MKRSTRRQKIARQNALAALVVVSTVVILWAVVMVALQGI